VTVYLLLEVLIASCLERLHGLVRLDNVLGVSSAVGFDVV
jgi:hypothetical protein